VLGARLVPWALALVAAALPIAADAHLGEISYSTLVARGDSVDYKLKFAAHLIPGSRDNGEQRLTRIQAVRLEPAILRWLDDGVTVESGGHDCVPGIVDTIGPDADDDLTVILRFGCTTTVRDLRVEFHAFDAGVPDYQNIVSLDLGGEKLGYVFTVDNPVMRAGETSARSSGFAEFFSLGVEHIWGGYDHLLFLLALLLPGGSLAGLAGVVTAFTLAHSITLALAVLDVVRLPPAPVEIAIALTIIYAAGLTLRNSAGEHRWRLTFFLGLVHGFGFAGILQAAGLEHGNVAVPLLAFNLGVETGQLVVVAAVIPLLALLGLFPRAAVVRRTLALLIVAAGVFWLAERTSGLVS
jgi:hypothetical protein